MGFEIVAVNSAKNRQLKRQQTVLRFHIRLKVTFSNSIYIELAKIEGNSGAMLISAVFGTR